MAVNKLDSNHKEAPPYSTQSVTHAANRLALIFVMNGGPQSVPPEKPKISSSGRTWEEVQTAVSGDIRLTCFRSSVAGPTTGAITFDFNGQQQYTCAWSVFEYDVEDPSANGLNAVRQPMQVPATNTSALSIPLAPFTRPTNEAVGGIAINGNRPVNPGANLKQIDYQNSASFVRKATLQTEARSASGPVEWSWSADPSAPGSSANANAVAIAVEILAPLTPEEPPRTITDVAALVRTFEPILFLHNEDSMIPADAKNYVENAALWTAADPADNKSSWGGNASQPLPRKPKIPAGGIRTENDGSPNFIGALVNRDTSTFEHFLELGGWKDKSGVAHSDVTSASSHPYSNREAIRDRYTNDSSLRDSRFRYHAELFESEALRELARSVVNPNLLATLDGLKLANPALLCYYLFFPASEQSVGLGCSTIEAEEFGAHAGQWACVALLLDRESPESDYMPQFVGTTGSRTPILPGFGIRRPQAFEDDPRANLKVERWRPAGGAQLPELTASHPHFFVSRGTHSIYMDSGPHEVDPFPDKIKPRNCGITEGGPDSWPSTNNVPDDEYLLLKAAVSGPFGILAAIGELLFGGGSYNAGGTNPADVIPDDVTGNGKTIHPFDLPIEPGWLSPRPWDTAGDFIVDRGKQSWWPSVDGRSGFNGRWGQRVEQDANSLRAGMRFPPFWKLFLLAIEDGRQTGLL